MDILNVLINSVDISEQVINENCQKIVQEIVNEKLTILDVTMKLQELVGSPDADKLENGLWILSTILQLVPITRLQHDEIVQFCMFYKGQLKGSNKMMVYTLNGILALSEWNTPMPERCFTQIITTMFQTVTCQAQMYSQRLTIYKILKNVLRTQKQEMLDLGPDFIYGVISAIDGERDPRNLMWLFAWIPEFIATVTLGHLVDEMFDTVSCYFPIDFRVPADSAHGLSRDTLADALKPCMCAHPSFATPAIQLAMEKLASERQIAKIDALQLLIYGCKKFPTEAYYDVAKDLWLQLHKEISSQPVRELQVVLLTFISELSIKLSSALQFESLFDDILNINLAALKVGENHFESSAQFLLAISQANRACADLVLPKVELLLMNSVAQVDDAKKVVILNILSKFLKVGNLRNNNMLEIPLQLGEFLSKQLEKPTSESHDLVIIEILHCLCFVTKQIKETAKVLLFELLLKLFLSEDLSINIQRALYDTILCYANDFHCWIGEPTQLTTENGDVEMESKKLFICIEHLCCLSVQEPFTTLVFEYLRFYYTHYPNSCLKSLCKVWDLNESQNKENIKNAMQSSRLIEEFVLNLSHCPSDTVALHHVRYILLKFTAELSLAEQSQLFEHHLPIIQSAMLENGQINEAILYYFAGLTTNVYPQLLNISNDFVVRFFRLSLMGNQIATELLASIVNKLPEEQIQCVTSFHEQFRTELCKTDANIGNVLLWLTKSLYMRGYQHKSQWISLIIAYIPRSELVARNLKLICSDWSLSNANRRLLFRQAFLTDIYQQLNECFTPENPNYITAFGSLFETAPPTIVKQYFVKVMRLIILCLENHEQIAGLMAILTIIHQFIASKDEMSLQYLNEFLPRLLIIASDGKSMQLRILALRCLASYINDSIPVYKLLPFKQQVIDALGTCIDDKKRLVRKEAVDARIKWYLLDAPQ